MRLQDYTDISEASDVSSLETRLIRFANELDFGIISGALVVEHAAGRVSSFYLGNTPETFSATFASTSIGKQAACTTPALAVTLQSLADRASMSRSTFAIRFKEAVGESAMEYLVRWRMMLAGDKLLHSNQSVSDIAYSLGCESDSAFGAAFRRVMGCSPRRFASDDALDSGAPNDGVLAVSIRLDAIPD